MTTKFAAPFLLILLCSFSSNAEPLLQKEKLFEIDWGNLRLRFAGNSAFSGDEPSSFLQSEEKAFINGLFAIKKAIPEFFMSYYATVQGLPQPDPAFATLAGEKIENSTYLTKSDYFGDGSVQVQLESQLANVFYRQDLPLNSEEEKEPTGPTGVVFKCSTPIKPQAIYRLVDEAGNELFSMRDMPATSFKRNLMGRWFVKATPAEVRKNAGPQPIVLSLKPQNDRNFMVEGGSALKENLAVLQAGRIIFDLDKKAF